MRTAAECRSHAGRARRLAEAMTDDATRTALENYATELDAEAAALEAGQPGMPGSPPDSGADKTSSTG